MNIQDLLKQLRDHNINNNESLTRFSLVKYNAELNKENISDLGINSGIGESLPWFLDEIGNIIDYNQKINLENGIKFASNFLSKRLHMDKNDISNFKIMEILKPFAEGKNTTLLEFYSHLSSLFYQNKDLLKETTLTENLSENLAKAEVGTASPEGPFGLEQTNIEFQPLGSFGEYTLNELILKFKKLEFPLKDVKIDLDFLKVVPTLWLYRGIVNTYINSAYPLSTVQNMVPSKVKG
jgi:midasin (ATPase involved in ribosome maturation)